MDTAAWVGILAGLVAIAGAVIGYGKFLVQAPLLAKNAALEAEKARVEGARAELERQISQGRERLADLESRYRILEQDFVNLKLNKTGVLLKHEIDTDLMQAMNVLRVHESSILLPGPRPNSDSFVFLSIYGPAAEKLRKAKLASDKGIVGRVFGSGTLHNTSDAYGDPNFFAGIDKKGEHETRSLLTVPLRHDGRVIAVLQFLNKPNGFTRDDEAKAEQLAAPLAAKVASFASDPQNFEVLGLAWRSDDKEATIAFCDLTASSSLLANMNVASAVDCINEYLEQHCDVAMRHGATIDKYLGDGVMIRFNVPRPIAVEDHAVRAVEAAVEMRREFGRLKQGWANEGLPVAQVYCRIGLSCGPVYEARIGHPQFQQITVIGTTVNQAAILCEAAPRDRDVIIIDDMLSQRLGGRMVLSQERFGSMIGHEVLDQG